LMRYEIRLFIAIHVSRTAHTVESGRIFRLFLSKHTASENRHRAGSGTRHHSSLGALAPPIHTDPHSSAPAATGQARGAPLQSDRR
jgi:hypothetical protein